MIQNQMEEVPMDPSVYMNQTPSLAALSEEKAQLERELRKKPIVFVILAGVGFLLAVSFLRISLETYASPGDETLIARIGTVLLVAAILFLLAAGAFLVIFIVKMSGRKKKNRRLQEINQKLQQPKASYIR